MLEWAQWNGSGAVSLRDFGLRAREQNGRLGRAFVPNKICCVGTFQTGSKINAASAPSQTIQPPKKAERVNDSATSVLSDLHL